MTIYNLANPSEEQIHEELSTEFPEHFSQDGGTATEGFLEKCVSIGHFLSQSDNLRAGLAKLDRQLQLVVDAKLEQVLKHYKSIASAQSTADLQENKLESQLKHLVSLHLTKKEVELDFTLYNVKGYEFGKTQTYTRFLPATSFREQVANGCHWKDPTVPGLHGEYTHRLQWYLLATELAQQLEKPVAVFREVGHVVWPQNAKVGLWDALFDRNGGEAPDFIEFKVPEQSFDGRSPERFTSFVIDESNEGDFPILHWFVKARLNKRVVQLAKTQQFGFQYVTRKFEKYGLESAGRRAVTGRIVSGNIKGGTGILKPGPISDK